MSPQTKLIKRKGENEKGKSQARTKIIPANFVVKLSTRLLFLGSMYLMFRLV